MGATWLQGYLDEVDSFFFGGLVLGEREGACVCALAGDKMGARVAGALVGGNLGAREGVFVGGKVGARKAALVGDKLRAREGALVGDGVDDAVVYQRLGFLAAVVVQIGGP